MLMSATRASGIVARFLPLRERTEKAEKSGIPGAREAEERGLGLDLLPKEEAKRET